MQKQSSRGVLCKVFLEISKNSQENKTVNFVKFLRTHFFHRTPSVAASGDVKDCIDHPIIIKILSLCHDDTGGLEWFHYDQQLC